MGRHIKRVMMADAHWQPETNKTKAKLARHLGKTARAARMQAKLTQADVVLPRSVDGGNRPGSGPTG
jgi:hypothetical protein